MPNADDQLLAILQGYDNFLRNKNFTSPKHALYLVRWVRAFLQSDRRKINRAIKNLQVLRHMTFCFLSLPGLTRCGILPPGSGVGFVKVTGFMYKISLWSWIIVVGALASSGCSSRTFSTTSRTAIEQLLLTRAVDLAMIKFDMPELADKKVFIDFTNLKCYETEYVKVAVRNRIAQTGSLLVDSADAADLTIEVAAGAHAMEYKEGVIGMPPLPVPNSPVPLPAMAIFKTTEQTAIVKLLLFVHKSGKFVASHTYYAKADRDESFIMQWRSSKQDDVRTGWEQAELKPKGERLKTKD